MSSESQEDGFNKEKAELFEALGHPTRIKILKVISESPLGFSELKREVNMESSGLLTFHLGKLASLVKTDIDGHYVLTDEGHEAVRITSYLNQEVKNKRLNAISIKKAAPIILTIVVIIVISFFILQSILPNNYQQSVSGIVEYKIVTNQLSYNVTTPSENYVIWLRLTWDDNNNGHSAGSDQAYLVSKDFFDTVSIGDLIAGVPSKSSEYPLLSSPRVISSMVLLPLVNPSILNSTKVTLTSLPHPTLEVELSNYGDRVVEFVRIYVNGTLIPFSPHYWCGACFSPYYNGPLSFNIPVSWLDLDLNETQGITGSWTNNTLPYTMEITFNDGSVAYKTGVINLNPSIYSIELLVDGGWHVEARQITLYKLESGEGKLSISMKDVWSGKTIDEVSVFLNDKLVINCSISLVAGGYWDASKYLPTSMDINSPYSYTIQVRTTEGDIATINGTVNCEPIQPSIYFLT